MGKQQITKRLPLINALQHKTTVRLPLGGHSFGWSLLWVVTPLCSYSFGWSLLLPVTPMTAITPFCEGTHLGDHSFQHSLHWTVAPILYVTTKFHTNK